METRMLAGLIFNPIGLITSLIIPTIAVLLARRPQLPAGRLVAGYIGALFALAIVDGAMSYVSPQEAVAVWHVPPERYWDEMVEQFAGVFIATAFFSIVGISVVGIPVLIALSHSGRATAPLFLVASAVISIIVSTISYLLMYSTSNLTFLRNLTFSVISHGVLTFGFSVAARLPWAFKVYRNTK